MGSRVNILASVLYICLWSSWLQIHYSNQGRLFKSKAQSMHVEILRSPWLWELVALHINLRENNLRSTKAPAFFYGCSLTYKDGKPSSLTCELFDSNKLDIDLTCSICLVSFGISQTEKLLTASSVPHAFIVFWMICNWWFHILKLSAAQMLVGWVNDFALVTWTESKIYLSNK